MRQHTHAYHVSTHSLGAHSQSSGSIAFWIACVCQLCLHALIEVFFLPLSSFFCGEDPSWGHWNHQPSQAQPWRQMKKIIRKFGQQPTSIELNRTTNPTALTPCIALHSWLVVSWSGGLGQIRVQTHLIQAETCKHRPVAAGQPRHRWLVLPSKPLTLNLLEPSDIFLEGLVIIETRPTEEWSCRETLDLHIWLCSFFVLESKEAMEHARKVQSSTLLRYTLAEKLARAPCSQHRRRDGEKFSEEFADGTKL